MATNKENLKTTPIAERFITEYSWTDSGSISKQLASVTPYELDLAEKECEEPAESESIFVLSDGTPALMPEEARKYFCLGIRYKNMALAAHQEFVEIAQPISKQIDLLQFKQNLYKVPGLCDKEAAEINKAANLLKPQILRAISKRDEYSTKCKLLFDQVWEICYDLIGRVSELEGCDCIGVREGWVLVKRNHDHSQIIGMLQEAGIIDASNNLKQKKDPDIDDYAEFFKKNDTIL